MWSLILACLCLALVSEAALSETNHGSSENHSSYEYGGYTPAEQRAFIQKHNYVDDTEEKKKRYEALAIHIERINGHIIAYGKDCDQLKNTADLIAHWKRRLDSSWSSTPLKDCFFNTDKNRFELTIDEWVPQHVQEHLNQENLIGGFNCVNTALGASGFVTEARYSGQSFYESVMGSPMCERITDRNKMQPGDIITVGSNPSQRVRPSHAFVYISDQLSYEKPDNGRTKVRFNHTGDILKNWNVSQDCYPNGLEQEKCTEGSNRWAVVHRCQAQPIAVPEILKPYVEEANQLADISRPWLRDRLPEDPYEFLTGIAKARALHGKVDDLMEKEGIRQGPKEEALKWWAVQDRISGLYSSYLSAEGHAADEWLLNRAMQLPIEKALEEFTAYNLRSKELDVSNGGSSTWDPHITMLARRILKSPDKDLLAILSSKDDHKGKALKIALELEPEKMREIYRKLSAKYPELERYVLMPVPVDPDRRHFSQPNDVLLTGKSAVFATHLSDGWDYERSAEVVSKDLLNVANTTRIPVVQLQHKLNRDITDPRDGHYYAEAEPTTFYVKSRNGEFTAAKLPTENAIILGGNANYCGVETVNSILAGWRSAGQGGNIVLIAPALYDKPNAPERDEALRAKAREYYDKKTGKKVTTALTMTFSETLALLESDDARLEYLKNWVQKNYKVGTDANVIVNYRGKTLKLPAKSGTPQKTITFEVVDPDESDPLKLENAIHNRMYQYQ